MAASKAFSLNIQPTSITVSRRTRQTGDSSQGIRPELDAKSANRPAAPHFLPRATLRTARAAPVAAQAIGRTPPRCTRDVVTCIERAEISNASSSEKTVTSCVYLRSSSSEKNGGEHQQPLDKQVVLRRIRHQKRVNKVQTALSTFLPQQLSPEDAANQHHWMDDPFSP
jgi:hypothetical protein